MRRALLLLAACSAPAPSAPKPFLLVEDCRATPPMSVTRQQALEDAGELVRILRGGYAGYSTKSAPPLPSFEDYLRDIRGYVLGMPEPITVDALRELFAQRLEFAHDPQLVFSTLTFDGNRTRTPSYRRQQTFIGLPDEVAREGDMWRVGANVGVGDVLVSCNDRPVATVIRRVHEKIFGGLGGTWAAVTFDGRAVVCKMANGRTAKLLVKPLKPGKADDGPAFERNGARLRLRSLAASNDAFVQAATEVRDEPVIVLDVRGNSGGDDEAVRDFFGALIGPSQKSITRVDRTSDVVEQGRANDMKCNGQPHESRPATSPRVGSFTYQGWFVVVADRGCAAACELVIDYARQLPHAIVVGDGTAGVHEYGEPLPYRLPHSRIWIDVPSRHYEGAPPAGFTNGPDVYLDSDTPVAAIDEIAACVARETCRNRLLGKP